MEENDQHTETPFTPKKKKLLESNRILSLTALFVSACTLFILLYQTHLSNKMYYLEEKAQRMSVFPYLELGTSYTTQQYYRLILMNTGVGPAMIKDVKILYQDSVYQMSPSSFLTNIAKKTNYGYASIQKGRLIPVNETLEIISNETVGSPDIDDLAAFFNSDSLNIAVEYTSIYEDQTWTCYLKDTPAFPSTSESKAKH